MSSLVVIAVSLSVSGAMMATNDMELNHIDLSCRIGMTDIPCSLSHSLTQSIWGYLKYSNLGNNHDQEGSLTVLLPFRDQTTMRSMLSTFG